MKNPSVSVIIPNYNGLKLIKQNLTNVLKILRVNDELIIIDDASTDESVNWLIEKFSLKQTKNNLFKRDKVWSGKYNLKTKNIQIKVLVNHQNLRFGQSANKGVKLAKSALVFLINNDVSPKKNILEFLLPHFIDEQIFAVGCMEIESKINKKGGKNKLWFEKGRFFHSRADNYLSGETAWASGGSAMFDREKWLQLRGFDKAYYPAYWEDVDLSFRARKKGWRILFEEKAIVNHNHESTNIDVFGQRKLNKISWKNGTTFVLKNGNFWQKIAWLIWWPYWQIKFKI